MEQVRPPTVAEAVEDLKRQRCEYSKMVAGGNVAAQPSIDFIDNMLAQLVPGYTPPKGKGCCCEDK